MLPAALAGAEVVVARLEDLSADTADGVLLITWRAAV
jgi:hypothetical protein